MNQRTNIYLSLEKLLEADNTLNQLRDELLCLEKDETPPKDAPPESPMKDFLDKCFW